MHMLLEKSWVCVYWSMCAKLNEYGYLLLFFLRMLKASFHETGLRCILWFVTKILTTCKLMLDILSKLLILSKILYYNMSYTREKYEKI